MNKNLIVCPYCGCEYLPAEIYTRAFFGKPTNILRDLSGHIVGYSGEGGDEFEKYVCDRCDKKFTIEAQITYKTSEYIDLFEEDDTFKGINK